MQIQDAEYLAEKEVLGLLQQLVDKASLRKVGSKFGFSAQYLCQVLLGQRPLSKRLALCLGCAKEQASVIRYRRIQTPPA
jgi:hypothetical protein